MLLLQLLVFFDERVDTVNHGLDQLNLAVTQAMLVRDVVSDPCLAPTFSPGTTGLDTQLLTSGLEGRKALLGVARQVHVHTGAHACSEISGAAVDVSVLGVEHEVSATLLLHTVAHSLDTA